MGDAVAGAHAPHDQVEALALVRVRVRVRVRVGVGVRVRVRVRVRISFRVRIRFRVRYSDRARPRMQAHQFLRDGRVERHHDDGVAVDAAVDERLHALRGDEPLLLQDLGECVAGGEGELEGEQSEHQDHDAVAVVGAERAVGLSCLGLG